MVGSDRGTGSRYIVKASVTLPIVVNLYSRSALGPIDIEQDYHVVEDLEVGSIDRNSDRMLRIPLIIVGFGVVFDIQAIVFVKIVEVIDVLGFGEMISDQAGQLEITFVPRMDSDSIVFLLPALLA
jgi:hypothetical protein